MILHRIAVLILAGAMAAHAQPASTAAQTNGNSAENKLRLLDPGASVAEQTNGTGLNLSTIRTQPAGETAGIFSTLPLPPIKNLLASLAPGASITEHPNGDRTNYLCAWPDLTVRLTVASNWPGAVQRPAWKNWVDKFPDSEKNTPAVQALLKKIDGSVTCVGSVITPQYDPAGKAASLVLGLATRLNGFVFAQDSLYDPMGGKIIGASNAPAQFKDQK